MNEEIDLKNVTVPLEKLSTLSIGNINPSYTMMFHRDGKLVGTLDFNGPQMKFYGDMEDSAKIFFEFVVESFKGRLEKERQDEREECAKVCEELKGPHKSYGLKIAKDCALLIRARGEK